MFLVVQTFASCQQGLTVNLPANLLCSGADLRLHGSLLVARVLWALKCPTRAHKMQQKSPESNQARQDRHKDKTGISYGSLWLPPSFCGRTPSTDSSSPTSWTLPGEDELLTLRPRSPGPALAGNKHLSGWGTQDVKH